MKQLTGKAEAEAGAEGAEGAEGADAGAEGTRAAEPRADADASPAGEAVGAAEAAAPDRSRPSARGVARKLARKQHAAFAFARSTERRGRARPPDAARARRSPPREHPPAEPPKLGPPDDTEAEPEPQPEPGPGTELAAGAAAPMSCDQLDECGPAMSVPSASRPLSWQRPARPTSLPTYGPWRAATVSTRSASRSQLT